MTGATTLVTLLSILMLLIVVVLTCFLLAIKQGLKPEFCIAITASDYFKIQLNLKTN